MFSIINYFLIHFHVTDSEQHKDHLNGQKQIRVCVSALSNYNIFPVFNNGGGNASENAGHTTEARTYPFPASTNSLLTWLWATNFSFLCLSVLVWGSKWNYTAQRCFESCDEQTWWLRQLSSLLRGTKSQILCKINTQLFLFFINPSQRLSQWNTV